MEGDFQNGLSKDRSTFQTVNGMVYDIHFGSILGLPGRILVFLASLIGASLPVTGFIFWLGKKERKLYEQYFNSSSLQFKSAIDFSDALRNQYNIYPLLLPHLLYKPL